MIQLAAGFARHLTALGESRPDGELLAAFLANRDEESFACLIRRHGPLVWAACRRMLPDAADAEDAFQSSFLVLVRRARRLMHRDTLGPWLYQVAVWTARNIRRRNARMLAKRRPLPDPAAPCAAGRADLHADLDEALSALPEKYRVPLVLCHLQGWSRREAAARIGCPEGTLSSLLARGLDRLRLKLTGLDPAKALAVAMPAVPLALAGSTAKAAAGVPLALAASATVSHLVEGVLRMFWIKKATAASVALLAVFGFGMGIGVSVKQVPSATAGDGPPVAVPAEADLAKFELLLAVQEKERVEAEVLVQQLTAEADQAKKDGKFEKLAEALEKLAKEQEKLARLRSDKDSATESIKLLALRKSQRANEELEKQKKLLADLAEQLRAAEALAREQQDLLELAKQKKDADLAKRAQVELDAALRGKERLMAEVKRLDDLIEKLIADAKPAPPIVRSREQRELEAQIQKLKAEQEALTAQAHMLAMRREEAQRQLAALEAKRAEANRAPVEFTPDVGTIDLTINAKDAAQPFKAIELGADGKPVGTLTFDNIEILTRYLTRTGKDAKGPKSVKLTVQADTKFEVIKQIVEACAAAGLTPPATLNLGKAKASNATAEDYAGLIELYYKKPR